MNAYHALDPSTSSQRTIEAGAVSSATTLTDEDRLGALVRRFLAGEVYAFDALFEQLTPRVMPLISRFFRDREDAEDAFQELSLQLYRALPRFRGDCAVTTFVYRISMNICLNAKQRNSRQPLRFTELSSPDNDHALDAALPSNSQGIPERLLFSHERQHALHEAILSLSPQFRAVLVLADVCGMKYEEIASITNAPVNTVRTRLKRARETMQKKILQQRELFNDLV